MSTVAAGDLVVAPFIYSDGTCDFCEEGLPSSCIHGGIWGRNGVGGGQAEAIRVPQADGTLVKLPVGPDNELMPGLLDALRRDGRPATTPPSPPGSGPG